VAVVAIERPDAGRRRALLPALPDSRFVMGDVLLAAGPEAAAARLINDQRLEALPIDAALRDAARRQFGGVEVLIPPDSPLIGRTVQQADLRRRFGLVPVAISRKGERIRAPIDEIHLELGDVLLLAGAWERVPALQSARRELLVLRVPSEMHEVAPARTRAPLALAVVLAMLVLMTFDLVPGVTAVLMAALALVLGGCVGMTDAYRAINWQSLVLIAGMIPMATALERSGGVDLMVDGLMAAFAGASPRLLMAALFLLTSVLSQVISNTATTVLLAPIAIAAASGLGVSPRPLLMAVAIAASTAFATPVASPVNTLILGPGGYRFVDFVELGVPLQLIAMIVALLAIPLLFPF
jgi:di/tricarboxylate transporter